MKTKSYPYLYLQSPLIVCIYFCSISFQVCSKNCNLCRTEIWQKVGHWCKQSSGPFRVCWHQMSSLCASRFPSHRSNWHPLSYGVFWKFSLLPSSTPSFWHSSTQLLPNWLRKCSYWGSSRNQFCYFKMIIYSWQELALFGKRSELLAKKLV